MIEPTPPPEPITNFILFAQSQPEYITQYYTKIKCKYPAIEMYTLMKETNKITIATGGVAIKYKGLLNFVLTTDDGSVLLSCYR